MIKSINRAVLTIAFSLSAFPQLVIAAERWFEIELVIFSHDDSAENIQETFEPHIKPILVNKARDLISPEFAPPIHLLRSWLGECSFNRNAYSIDAVMQPFSPINNKFIATPVNIAPESSAFQNDSGSSSLSPNESISSELTHSIDLDSEYLNRLIVNFDENKLNDFDIETLTFAFAKPSWNYPINCITPSASQLNPDYELLTAADNSLFIKQLPRTMQVIDDETSQVPYLLSDDKLEFKKEVAKFRWRKDITLLIHLAWRQPVKPSAEELPWRIYAGNNYSKSFDYYGEPLTNDVFPNQEPVDANQNLPAMPIAAKETLNHQKILNNIQNLLGKIDNKTWQAETALADKQQETWLAQQKIAGTPKQVWQLDGLFKIYLQHYLFIETEFNLREVGQHPAEQNNNTTDTQQLNLFDQPKNFLYAYYFQQNRRIRSGEIHYFDHPKMGMVLQVRKFFPDSVSKTEQDSVEVETTESLE